MTIAWIGARNTSIAILAGLAAVLVAGLFTVASANPDNGLRNSNKQSICDSSRAGQWERFNFEGRVYFGQNCGAVAEPVLDLDGNPVRSDAPAPGILRELQPDGSVKSIGVYEGERRRNIAPGAPKGPLTYRDNQGAVQDGEAIWESNDGRHRAVYGDDGSYYREELIRGRWVRSAAYNHHFGIVQTGRSVIWNAYYRCQGGELQSKNWWGQLYGTSCD